MIQWVKPWSLNQEAPSMNPSAVAVVPLGKALYPHCLVPRKGLNSHQSCGWLLTSSLHSKMSGNINPIRKLFQFKTYMFKIPDLFWKQHTP